MEVCMHVRISDSEKDFAYVLGEILVGAGFEASIIPSGPEGIRTVVENPTDLVITDLAYGEIHGKIFIWYLRESGYTGPILVLTGARPDDRLKFEAGLKDRGVSMVIYKGVDIEVILRGVRELVAVSAT